MATDLRSGLGNVNTQSNFGCVLNLTRHTFICLLCVLKSSDLNLLKRLVINSFRILSRLDNDNKENVYVGDVCEVAAKKRKKDFFNNNTKSQCKIALLYN